VVRSVNTWIADHDRALRVVAVLVLVVVLLAVSIAYARKAAKGGSAFMRWRPIVLKLGGPDNIYTPPELYPNPPMMAMVLWPFARLPGHLGALVWLWLKVGMAVLSAWWVFSWLGRHGEGFGFWARAAVILLWLRPVLSDLRHGNINLLILVLVCACWDAYRRGRDVRAGVLLGLAITLKVTPGLLAAYFVYKRRWLLAGACIAGAVLFLIVIPSMALGIDRNWELLGSWSEHMVLPFLRGRVTQFETENTNQSLTGLCHRLLRPTRAIENSTYTAEDDVYVHVVSLSERTVGWIVKGISLVLLGLLGWLCRAPGRDRRHPLAVAELGLVLLAMLFMSERSWKAHYVTLLVPYAVLVWWTTTQAHTPRDRRLGRVLLGVSFALVTGTASGLIGSTASDYAEAYGLFMLGGMVLFAALGLILHRARRSPPS